MLSYLAYVSLGSLACIAVPVCFVLLVALISHRRHRRKVQTLLQNDSIATLPPACVCGYSQRGLHVPRCPECGRVSGFDATPEELGLTDEQLRLAMDKRQARQRQSP